MSQLTPIISDLSNEQITELSNKFWSPNTCGQWQTFDNNIICDIYRNQIYNNYSFNFKQIMILELSQYLENYLWPNYLPQTNDSFEHLMSIVVMINEKFREKVDVWQTFQSNHKYFGDFMSQITHLIISENNELSIKERIAILLFLIHCFNSVEVDLIRNEIQRYVSLPIWCNLSEKRLSSELENSPKLRKIWNAIQKKDKRMNSDLLEKVMFERKFLANLIKQFFKYLSTIPSEEDVKNIPRNIYDTIHYCERFLELLIDLEALLPTRRFFNSVLDDMHVISVAKCSNLNNRPLDGNLFHQLLEMLKFYANFEIDDITGEALTERLMMKKHYESIIKLQKVVFKSFPELRELYISNVSAIDTRTSLSKHLKKLNESQLIKLASLLDLGDEQSLSETCDSNFLTELIVSKHERCSSQLQAINEMPIYPSELIIWDESLVSLQFSNRDECFALPKLNLQFLTLHDYLLRNFHLFRLESTYEIRQDIQDSVSRMKPWKTEDGGVMFGGWARMGLAIDSFTIVEVGKPNIGENQPSRVRADIIVNLNVRREIKNEWESLRKHDVCFLICVRPTSSPGTAYHFKEPFIPQVGLTYVRGCEVEGMLDPQGKILDETSHDKPFYNTDNRTFRVWLDSNQYKIDMDNVSRGQEDVYDTFNIIIRRKPKENNFKAVLETIRDLMNTECVVPEWLRDVILGYDDPAAAHYSNLPTKLPTIDFYDTFLDFEHVKQAFGDMKIEINDNDKEKMVPPFKITFKESSLVVTPYIILNRGPYYVEMPKKNAIRFTATQIEAIKSGIQPGLTLVVGPPGTGKTDIAVQIISALYHNFPDQRTLIVTHSNQALNALFEKIMALDIDERHLLRLGHGEEALETDKDFSRYGRVNYVLSKRLELLNKVTLLASSMAINADVSYTCETASYFYLHHVLSRWEEYLSKLSASRSIEHINTLFPFVKFFEDSPQPLFKGITFEEDLEIARGCFRYIKKIFTQLDEFKAFEMLRSGSDRSNYLLVREAKIIAMTCTHAALKRKELVNVGFQYDNILMEESAQILEIETFIPLLLQNPEHGHNRLKRFIMIGDHLQLPPVIKNLTFQKYSNMEQSLFTRLVRLGVPTVDLDSQGRSRPSMRSLYDWRYKNLGDLPHILSDSVYQFANIGFRFDYQLINVDDFNGVGESEPVPYFYQNLAEAEFIVATFMYMRLLGYSAEKISILTTYNGQKHLIRDVIKQRCSSNPFIGQPYKVTTVDKYQGQQNDYILLSLVRTKTVGHIRDVRRLIVAMSRARLGLYVFARTSLFRNCFELWSTFKLLCERPLQLQIVPFESDVTDRKVNDIPHEKECLVINNMTEMVQFVYQFYQRKIEEWKTDKPEVFDVLSNGKNNKQEDIIEMDDQNVDEDESKQSNEEEFEFEKLTENDDGINDEQHIDISDEV